MRWYQCYILYLHAKVSNCYINFDNILANYDVPEGWPGKVVKHGKGEVPGPPVWFEEEDVQEAVAGVGYQSDNQRESDVFFYHTDHLQSTTYLTDSVGNVSQFVWYAPYGEALIDEHVGSYENTYKFSGKELDENTGLYDHGARHRDPAICGWYGVDPLFEQFPEVSPFHYCHANPVRLVDLNGMFDTEDEVMWFSFHNDINGPATQRQDGSYELYDPNTRFTYYHDEDGVLHTEIPEVSVSVVHPAQVESPTLFDHIANGLTTADEWTNDVVRPIASGGILFIPIISLTNSVYTLYFDEDIYGNEAKPEDYALSASGVTTYALGKLPLPAPLKIVVTIVDWGGTVVSAYNTIDTEYDRNK